MKYSSKILLYSKPIITFYSISSLLYPYREGYTVKFFFQSISWNTVSGVFHETGNTFMKYFYLST